MVNSQKAGCIFEMQNFTLLLIQGYRRAVVTPNAMEFSRLVKSILCKDVPPSVLPDPKLVAELSTALGHVTVVHKGIQ